MQTHHHQKNLIATLLLLLLALLLTTGCSMNDNEYISQEKGLITVEITESEINGLLKDPAAISPVLLPEQVFTVDINEGSVHVSGLINHTELGLLPASFDFTVTEANGSLGVDLTALEIEGMEGDEEMREELNALLKSTLSKVSKQKGGKFKIFSISLEDDTVKVQVQLERHKRQPKHGRRGDR